MKKDTTPQLTLTLGGNSPFGTRLCEAPEYRELSHKISEETAYFKKTLSPEGWKRLEQLDAMIYDRSAAYSYENFLYGFRLGVALMIEILTGRNENK